MEPQTNEDYDEMAWRGLPITVKRTEMAILIVMVILTLSAGWLQYQRLRVRAGEAAVRGNAHTTQLAAEIYAAQHAERYATDVVEIVEYFPGGKPLINPLDGSRLVFDGSAGDLTYSYSTPGADYRITAFGRDGEGGTRPLLVLSSSRR